MPCLSFVWCAYLSHALRLALCLIGYQHLSTSLSLSCARPSSTCVPIHLIKLLGVAGVRAYSYVNAKGEKKQEYDFSKDYEIVSERRLESELEGE